MTKRFLIGGCVAKDPADQCRCASFNEYIPKTI